MSWCVVHLQAECTADEGWRKARCECGLKRCTRCNEFFDDTMKKGCKKCKTTEHGEVIEHGEPLWPEKWPCRELALKKFTDATSWESSYQGRPVVGGGYKLANYPLCRYEKINRGDFNVYLLCDPSLARTKRSDRVAIPVIGTGFDQNFYILDGVVGRFDATERTDHLFRLYTKWRPSAVGYEEYGLMTDIVQLKHEMERRNCRFVVTPLGRGGEWNNHSKVDRIDTMIPQARSGRWYAPKLDDPTLDPLFKEFLLELDKEWAKYAHGGGYYDDILDATSRINDPAMKVTFPINIPIPAGAGVSRRQPGLSWMV